MRVAIDTNVLAYIAGVVMAEADRGKAELAREQVAVIRRSADAVLPTQVMGELYHLLTRRGEDRSRARETVRSFGETHIVVHAVTTTFLAALDLASEDRLQFWDALILATANEAGCTLLLSEDMQDGFTVRGLTVVNPFSASPHPKLRALLKR